jgi:esterase/lipase
LKIIYKILAAAMILPPVIYFLGPAPKTPAYGTVLPKVPELQQLESYVRKKESNMAVKPGNDARIIWADQDKKQTEYAVVYLHGFSASHEEGNPVHVDFAKKYHCNLYLSRLAEHGLISPEPMLNFTADKLWDSALEAYAIGRKLGKKVILMSTSTGGTLSLKMASEFPEISSLILYSPNIAIRNENARLLNNHWGLQLARKVQGSNDVTSAVKLSDYAKFWYPRYRLEAAVQLQELTETSMTKETFEKVKQPVLMLYYYRDIRHQDNVVSVDAMLSMFGQLGTPSALKRKAAIPNAGNHVIGSAMRSADIATVEKETERFANEILKITPVSHH